MHTDQSKNICNTYKHIDGQKHTWGNLYTYLHLST